MYFGGRTDRRDEMCDMREREDMGDYRSFGVLYTERGKPEEKSTLRERRDGIKNPVLDL